MIAKDYNPLNKVGIHESIQIREREKRQKDGQEDVEGVSLICIIYLYIYNIRKPTNKCTRNDRNVTILGENHEWMLKFTDRSLRSIRVFR